MPRPVTPFVGCDVFVRDDEDKILLIRRQDNGLWALPGGCQDLGESPATCAIRECREETGYEVELIALLGVFSSSCYEYVHYPWKDNEFTHLLFSARIVGGSARTSDETLEVSWFDKSELPELSDGHEPRIRFALSGEKTPYFE